jgi:CIC family chloride channel protein
MPVSGWINRSGYLRKCGARHRDQRDRGPAVVFYLALDYAGKFLLGYLAGYDVPQAKDDDGGTDRRDPCARVIPLVTFDGALGIGLAGIEVRARGEGNGTDSAMELVWCSFQRSKVTCIYVKGFV